MNKINPDEPAFPVNYVVSPEGTIYNSADDKLSGLSIRAHIAAMAMQGILSSLKSGQHDAYTVNGGYIHFPSVANDSVVMADALIEALNK